MGIFLRSLISSLSLFVFFYVILLAHFLIGGIQGSIFIIGSAFLMFLIILYVKKRTEANRSAPIQVGNNMVIGLCFFAIVLGYIILFVRNDIQFAKDLAFDIPEFGVFIALLLGASGFSMIMLFGNKYELYYFSEADLSHPFDVPFWTRRKKTQLPKNQFQIRPQFTWPVPSLYLAGRVMYTLLILGSILLFVNLR